MKFGVRVGNVMVSPMLFCDDIIAAARSFEDLCCMVPRLREVLRTIGLEFKEEKCKVAIDVGYLIAIGLDEIVEKEIQQIEQKRGRTAIECVRNWVDEFIFFGVQIQMISDISMVRWSTTSKQHGGIILAIGKCSKGKRCSRGTASVIGRDPQCFHFFGLQKMGDQAFHSKKLDFVMFGMVSRMLNIAKAPGEQWSSWYLRKFRCAKEVMRVYLASWLSKMFFTALSRSCMHAAANKSNGVRPLRKNGQHFFFDEFLQLYFFTGFGRLKSLEE